MNFSRLFLLGITLILGLRHGLDWDHIAAISDITTLKRSKRVSFIYGMSYVLGHSLTIIILGTLAILFGIKLPSWVDSIMEPFIGVTLIILGLWLVISLLLQKKVKPISRWMLMFKGVKHLKNLLNRNPANHSHKGFDKKVDLGFKSTFGLGIIHGIGAETPTQLLLFATAASLKGIFLGCLVILTFVIGLIMSNTFIVLLSIFGINYLQNNPKIYTVLSAIGGVLSIIVGILFLIGQSSLLPSLFGG